MSRPFPTVFSRAFSALLALGLSSSLLVAQPAAAPASLSAAIQRAAANLKAGGLILAEVHDGKITYASAGHPAPSPGLAPEKVLVEIGSITKVLTALLLAQAVLENKAKLDDPISRHLPADLALKPSVAAITLEQLATHTSGLPRMPKNFAPANPSDPYADYTTEKLYAFLSAHEITATPPHASDYSNIGFGLLGHLVERILGQPYATLIQERIARPLGLADFTITLSPDQLRRFATPHSGGKSVHPWHITGLAGAGAVRATAADLARFAQALLANQHPPLTAAWNLIREPRVELPARHARLGLAVFIGQQGDTAVYNHGGGTGGFRTYLEIVPAQRRATVLFINNDSIDPGGLVARTRAPASAAAGSINASAHDLKSRPETPLDPTRAADYSGVYATAAHGKFTVVIDAAGRPRIRLTGQTFLPVFHTGNDRFFARAVAAEFQFHRNTDAKIDSLTLHQHGREIPAKRTDAPVPRLLFPPPDKLRAYTGTFALSATHEFEVDLRGGNLHVKLTGQSSLPVFSDAPDHFVYDAVEAALTFERDTSGKVTALVLHQNGRDQRAPRVATPPKS